MLKSNLDYVRLWTDTFHNNFLLFDESREQCKTEKYMQIFAAVCGNLYLLLTAVL